MSDKQAFRASRAKERRAGTELEKPLLAGFMFKKENSPRAPFLKTTTYF